MENRYRMLKITRERDTFVAFSNAFDRELAFFLGHDIDHKAHCQMKG